MKSISFIIILLLCSSCSQRLYYPDRANAPAFTEAHEVKATLSIKPEDILGNSDNSTRVAPAFDVAYAPINHLGIIASYRSVVNKDAYLYPVTGKPENYSSSNTMVTLNGHRFEAGAGYFTGFGGAGVFEAYAGYGNGMLKADPKINGTAAFTTRYNRYFVQAESGIKNDIISVVGGLRFATQDYYSFDAPDKSLRYAINADPVTQNPSDLTSQRFYFLEPFVEIEAGYRFLFFNMQLGGTAQMDKNATMTADVPLFLSMGITWQFTPSLWKEKKEKHH